METFGDYAYYYNAFYQDKNYQDEAKTIHKLLTEYGNPDIHEIINFGCGTGKHDIELTRLGGYHCEGIDMSPLMIETAKRNSAAEGLDIDFSVHDIRNYAACSPKDAVISLFHVMSYQNSNTDILNTFQSARACVRKGGIFLFDVWYGPGVLSNKPCVRVKEAEDEKNRLIRIARPVMHNRENTVDVHYEVLVINKKTDKVQVINEVHGMRYFFKPELEFFLKQARFELVDNLDCNTLDSTDYASWTSYFIAEAV